MTELRQRMVNDMMLRGMAEKTRRAYTGAVAGLAKFYRRSPDQISHEDGLSARIDNRSRSRVVGRADETLFV